MLMRRRHVLKQAWVYLAAISALGSIGCAENYPNEDAGREVLRLSIDKGKSDRIRIAEFVKRDGVASNVDGVDRYTMHFETRAEFVGRANFGSNNADYQGDHLTSWPWAPPKPYSLGFAESGVREAQAGDTLVLQGEIEFEKRESGWTAVRILYAHSLARGEDPAQTNAGVHGGGNVDGAGPMEATPSSYTQHMIDALQNLAKDQEIHYSKPASNYTYVSRLSDFVETEYVSKNAPDIFLEIVTANRDGWSARASHPMSDSVCAMFVDKAPPLAPAQQPFVPACGRR